MKSYLHLEITSQRRSSKSFLPLGYYGWHSETNSKRSFRTETRSPYVVSTKQIFRPYP